MAEATASDEELADLTKCPTCQEVYKDPRSLPCIHTFCRQCIAGSSGDEDPAENQLCSVCKKRFTVPDDGVDGLPKNFFISRLVLTNELSRKKLCDWCLADIRISPDQKKTASVVCVDCQESLCDACSLYHSTLKVCASHKTKLIGEIPDENQKHFQQEKCQLHPSDSLRGYCNECDDAVCVECCLTQHTDHKWVDINSVVDRIRIQITEDTSQMNDIIEEVPDSLLKMAKLKKKIDDSAKHAEDEICKRAEELRQKIDQDKLLLLRNVNERKCSMQKAVDDMIEKIEHSHVQIANLVKYSNTLLDNGSNTAIVTEAKAMHKRSQELVNVYEVASTPHDTEFYICYTANHHLMTSKDNVVGKVTGGKLTFLTSIECTGTVLAVAMLGNRFAALLQQMTERYNAGKKLREPVPVFELATYNDRAFQACKVPLSNCQSAVALTACSFKNCFYVGINMPAFGFINAAKAIVRRIHHSSNSEGEDCIKLDITMRALSVSKASNILVVSTEGISEYIPDGSLLRKIRINNVWHVVELNSEMLAVTCHERVECGTTGGFSFGFNQTMGSYIRIINIEGEVSHEYSVSTGLSSTEPSVRSLTADKQYFILAADYHNNKILEANPTLTDVRPLPLLLQGGLMSLRRPFCLCLDDSYGRLLVGEHGEKNRLIVFERTCSSW